MAALIHERALVSNSRIGIGSSVWQFASVIRGAKIGIDCSIGACSVVDGASIGDCCAIGHGAQVHPGTVIGNDVFVGPGAIICNDRWPQVSKDGFETESLRTHPTVIVEDRASIGAGAIILPGVCVGRGAMIAAGVICGIDVPTMMLLRRDGTIEPMPDDAGASRRMTWAR